MLVRERPPARWKLIASGRALREMEKAAEWETARQLGRRYGLDHLRWLRDEFEGVTKGRRKAV